MASTDYRPIKNAVYRCRFALRDTANGLITGVTPSVTLSADDGSFAASTAVAVEVGSSGFYYIDLTAAEMANDSLAVRANGTGSVFTIVEIRTEPALDSGVVAAVTAGSVTLRVSASAVNDFYNGAVIEIVNGTGRGQTRTIVDYVGATKVATVDRDWATNPDTSSVYKIVPAIGAWLETTITTRANVDEIDANAAAATALKNLYTGGVIASSVNDAAATTTSFIAAAGTSAVDDWYNNSLIVFTSGTLAGLCRKVSDYTGSTRTITITPALLSAPANGVTFVILGNIV